MKINKPIRAMTSLMSPRTVPAMVPQLYSGLPVLPVLRVNADGSSALQNETPEDLRRIKRRTGLPGRDLRLLISEASPSFQAILARPSSGCFLLALDAIRLLCTRKSCLVLDPDHPLVKTFHKDLQQHLGVQGEKPKEPMVFTGSPSSSSRTYAFMLALTERDPGEPGEKGTMTAKSRSLESAVLEAALSCLTRKYRRQLNILRPMAEIMLHEMTLNPNEAALRRMLAFRKSLSAFESHVGEVSEAVAAVLREEGDLRGLCISTVTPAAARSKEEGDTADEKAVEDMELLLETYNADLKEVVNEMVKMKEQIEDTNDFIQMHLDSMRNRIMLLALFMNMGMLAVGTGALVTGFFGMNLTSGIEYDPNAFFITTGGVILLIGTMFSLFGIRYRAMSRDFSFAKGYLALKQFFHYIDNIEIEIEEQGEAGGLDRAKFQKLLDPLIGVTLTEETVDKIFKELDENKDGVVNVHDLDMATFTKTAPAKASDATEGMPPTVLGQSKGTINAQI